LRRATFLPIYCGGHVAGLTLLGAKGRSLTAAGIRPYATLMEVISAALDKLRPAEASRQRVIELDALTTISQAVSSLSDLDSFFGMLHAKVREIIGDYSFLVTLYDEQTDRISVPYSLEDGKPLKIEPFPRGEGLTSILIRTRKPLLLAEDTERKAAELGAKIVGRPARSWMGAPMIVQDHVIGALIIQDPDQERAFDEDDMRFFSALAEQVAGAINGVRLLEESRLRALRLETAAEIARDMGGSLDLDELLNKAVARSAAL
jgi:GAF domain-containing protein